MTAQEAGKEKSGHKPELADEKGPSRESTATTCSCTMVHENLVLKEQLIDEEATAVRYAHGNTVLYPPGRGCDGS